MSAPRWRVPEVIQTSAMDCGPACLAALAEGFGIRVACGRLREACQTDVDGTSIDTMEAVGNQLGLELEQIMLPIDHLALPEADALPAIVVTQQPNGTTHFVVAWRRHGPVIQLMDPALGRRYAAWSRFAHELYTHQMPVPAEAWREWASSEQAAKVFRRRVLDLGVPSTETARLWQAAVADPSWRGIGALDACTRMVASLVDAGALRKGAEAKAVLVRTIDVAHDREAGVPPSMWSVRPCPPADDGSEQVVLIGCVLVRAKGRRVADPIATEGLSPEIVAALDEPVSRPWGRLVSMLLEDGFVSVPVLLGAMAVASAAVGFEALLFRSAIHVGSSLALAGQRLAALLALVVFSVALLLLELPIAAGVLRVGRHLEVRMRAAFLEKIPKLNDRYFQSRLVSDMAERAHSAWQLRQVPELGRDLVRGTLQLAITVVGLGLLDPWLSPIAALAAVAAVAVPLTSQPVLNEADLRVRSHLGALSRFYLDALLGLVPIRAHGADRSVRREHEALLVEWARAARTLQNTAAAFEASVALFGAGAAVLLVALHLLRASEPASALLFVYWALAVPALGQQIARAAQQYPARRNLTLRLLEPLGAPEEEHPDETARLGATRGVGCRFESVSVVAAGHRVLEGLDVEIEPGTHVAIVGPSGAGKSSLVGLLLGWHRPSTGRVRVDGQTLDAATLEALRQQTAWVDPGVQLWNRSFLDNLLYGTDGDVPLGRVMEQAKLDDVLERLPDGLQTALGEAGAMVSGGEGQRVRFGRALMRRDARLVILDEPFRGLDRERRRLLLDRARRWWQDATMLCVTHDVADTRLFPRVLVVEGGRVVEDGSPTELASRSGSRFRALAEADDSARAGLWSGAEWKRVRIDRGRLVAGADG